MAEIFIKLTYGKKLSKQIKWSEDQQSSFYILKNKLKESPILRFPDFKKEFIIETDTSTVGLGAFLCQDHLVNGKKIKFPVVYSRRSLSSTKCNYGIIDLENFAVI